jgi:hypothetical protein
MVLACAAWGFRSLRRMPDVHFRFGSAPKPVPAPTAAVAA